MHTNDFSFELPEALIAQEPVAARDASRLLHLSRTNGTFVDRQFTELPGLLRRGDLLVLNDTRVIPARLVGTKRGTGGRAELLLVRPLGTIRTGDALAASEPSVRWLCLGQSSKGFRPGMLLDFDGIHATVDEDRGGGSYAVRFETNGRLADALERVGQLPLPPYISRSPVQADAARYQTIFAREAGSVAAPTAGLHFTPSIFSALDAHGVERAFVTLEVGPGTFLPVREGDVSKHVMHAERAYVSDEAASAIARARSEGRRIVAVGTTVVRTLESSAAQNGHVSAGSLETALFITPGYSFKAVDALITNFHLPRSTLLMLVSAFAGREAVLNAYRHAVASEYRFFSYGDAMLID